MPPSGAPGPAPERVADRRLRRVCVYCGSSPGTDPRFVETAAAVGRVLAEEGVGVVYGGGTVGLMGALADAALAAGGEVTGVIPKGLFRREHAHRGVTVLHEVGSMHERKRRMSELADGFVALPGGLGTLEELTETATWAQLGIHAKPVVILDVAGYWRPLVSLLDHAVDAGFLLPENRAIVAVVEAVEDLAPVLRTHHVPPSRPWLSAEQA